MADAIVIIGGGISGLTLALSLHEAGIPCRVFESAPVFKRLGVGINLQPYGVRELTKLGLLPALRSHSVEPCEMNYYNRFGQLVFSEPRGRSAGYESPQLSLHRGDFHQVLFDAVEERLGKDAIARTLVNPTPPMPPYRQLQQQNPQQFNQLVEYVASLRGD